MRGRSVCYHHGGKTPVGPAAPSYKHGRLSKHLPTGLRRRALAALADPDLLSLREGIAIIDSRLTEVLDKIAADEAPTTWEEAKALRDHYEVARRAKDVRAMQTHLEGLFYLVERGAEQDTRWKVARELIQERRRVVESERKHQIEMRQVVTAEQALAFANALADAVRRHVADEETLAAISNDLALLTAGVGTGAAS